MSVKNILSGYAQIFFSTDWYVGLLFLLATFIIPAQGLAGLAGFILASLCARALHLSQELIDNGYFAYNGMLVGLALALTYRVDWAFSVIFVGAITLSVPIAATLHSLSVRYLGTPPLSGPFVLASWLALTAGRRFPGLVYTVAPYEVETFVGLFPKSIDYVFRSLAAAFFQFSLPAGILVFLGILVFSRHALLLSIIGVASGAVVQGLLGPSFYHLDGGWLGFNNALTAIALGGIWVVPGFDSMALAAAGGLLCSLVTAASLTILTPMGLPVLAFPFVATTTLVLFALRQRVVEKPFRVLVSPENSPEGNVKKQLQIQRRQLSSELPGFYLPVRGPWIVTQGINGDITHRGMWAHAWDFEVADSDGSTYKDNGLRREDFYCYGLPVLAPAAGRVVNIVNDIPDNAVGQVNSEDNWGNVIILAHRGGLYSLLAHLAPGSIKVEVGTDVQPGAVLGRVGASGRAPTPHLHFQVQRTCEIGGPTVPAEFIHYVQLADNEQNYVTRGVPEAGMTLRSLVTDRTRALAGAFPLGMTWTYEVIAGNEKWIEQWQSQIDFLGNRSIECKKTNARLGLIIDDCSLITGPIDSQEVTGLTWFSLAIPRLPFTENKVSWQDCLPADTFLKKPQQIIHDFLEPFCSLASIRTNSRYLPAYPIAIETKLHFDGPLLGEPSIEIVSHFAKGRGLVNMRVSQEGEELCQIQLQQMTGDENNAQ